MQHFTDTLTPTVVFVQYTTEALEGPRPLPGGDIQLSLHNVPDGGRANTSALIRSLAPQDKKWVNSFSNWENIIQTSYYDIVLVSFVPVRDRMTATALQPTTATTTALVLCDSENVIIIIFKIILN